MDTIYYRDTRGLDTMPRTFTDTVVKGIAPGGGLYVPEGLPTLELADIVGLADLGYAARAARVYGWFGVEPAGTLKRYERWLRKNGLQPHRRSRRGRRRSRAGGSRRPGPGRCCRARRR